MKKHFSLFVLLATVFFTGCPANNGHAPFDIFDGTSSASKVAADTGSGTGITPSAISVASTSYVRGNSFYVTVTLNTSADYTGTSTDIVQVYAANSSLSTVIFSSTASINNAKIGEYSLSGTYFTSGTDKLVSVTATFPTSLSNGNYYLGAAVINTSTKKTNTLVSTSTTIVK
jgi:hypothetical protein